MFPILGHNMHYTASEENEDGTHRMGLCHPGRMGQYGSWFLCHCDRFMDLPPRGLMESPDSSPKYEVLALTIDSIGRRDPTMSLQLANTPFLRRIESNNLMLLTDHNSDLISRPGITSLVACRVRPWRRYIMEITYDIWGTVTGRNLIVGV